MPEIQTDARITQDWLQGMLAEMLGKAFAEEREKNIKAGQQILQNNKGFRPVAYDSAQAVKDRGRHDDRGLTFAGVVRALRVAQMAGHGDRLGFAKDWAAKNQDYNPAIAQALDSTVFAEGGALVPNATVSEIVEFLRPASVFRSLGPNFGRFQPGGKYEVGRITSGFTASRTGENRSISLTAAETGNIVGSPHDIAAMYVQSKQWMMRANPDADRKLRNDLARAVTQRQDLDYIRGDGTQFSVRGIKNTMQSANSSAATSSPTVAQVFADLGDLVLAIREADFGEESNGWIWAPRTTIFLWTLLDGQSQPVFRAEMAAGKLWNAPYRDTTLVPRNLGGGGDESEIYFANFAGFDVVDGESLKIDVSTEASYTTGGTTTSAFQANQVLTRITGEDDLVELYPGKCSAMKTAVDWTT